MSEESTNYLLDHYTYKFVFCVLVCLADVYDEKQEHFQREAGLVM